MRESGSLVGSCWKEHDLLVPSQLVPPRLDHPCCPQLGKGLKLCAVHPLYAQAPGGLETVSLHQFGGASLLPLDVLAPLPRLGDAYLPQLGVLVPLPRLG